MINSLVAGGGLISASVILVIFVVPEISLCSRGIASRSWPKVRGRVTELIRDENSHAVVKYQYAMAGTIYDSTCYNLINSNPSTFYAETYFPPQVEVTVWVDPADPGISVLQPGASWVKLVFSMVCLLMASMVLVVYGSLAIWPKSETKESQRTTADWM